MKLGYALTGSFCTIPKSLEVLAVLAAKHEIVPLISPAVFGTDTRFARAEDNLRTITETCRAAPITKIKDAEPLGPREPLDLLIICPCTGNTLAKLACGITDGAVTMAAKAHMRCDRPLVIALASNDALSQNLKNVATLLQRKGVYFVPFGQDDPFGKPHSLISELSLLPDTVSAALEGKQLQPLLSKN